MWHFSTQMKKPVCGAVGRCVPLTTDVSTVECQRCREIVQSASATEADLWALEAQEAIRTGRNSAALNANRIIDLYTLALLKREDAVKRAKQLVEYAEEELMNTAQRATDAGVVR